MTYLNSSSHFDPSHAADASEHQAVSIPGFSGLEWSVIALAQRDRVASLRQPGRMARALRNLFGTALSTPLADERLEALRRIAVLAWHYGYALPVSELRAFIDAGYSTGHYDVLQNSIARGRGDRSRRV